MAASTPRVQLWPFRKAPSRLRALFRAGEDTDWVARVPATLSDIAESLFLRLQQLHPVLFMSLPDGSAVYWGIPRESITLIAAQSAQHVCTMPAGKERRRGVRVPLACSLRYETGALAQKTVGAGNLINMSSSGAFFTTESSLRRNARVALHVAWPVRLDGDVPVELFAEGRIVRAERAKAALQYDRLAFKVPAP